METAGLGLGAAALFSTVNEIFKIVAAVRGFPESSAILFQQLELEREVFMRWGIEVGLYTPNAGEELPHVYVHSSIPRDLLPFLQEIVATMGQLLVDAASKRTRIQPNSTLGGALQSLKLEIEESRKAGTVFRRLGWAICKEADFKQLIGTIHSFNTRLHNLIPKPMQIRLDGSFIQRINSLPNLDQLQQINEASQGYRQDIFTATNVMLLSTGRIPIPLPLTGDLQLSRSSFASINTDFSRHFTTYSGRIAHTSQISTMNVLIEWRKQSLQVDPITKQRYISTCLDLVRLLHASQNLSSYRTLDCLGIFEDIECRHGPRIGLVYQVPEDAPMTGPSSPIQLSTLHDMMNSKTYNRPKLGQRFQLAQVLSVALHRILASRWYHKNLNSRNVIFFDKPHNSSSRQSTDLDEVISDPYLVGFEYARPDSANQDTIKAEQDEFCDLYRHPLCTDSHHRQYIPYTRRFDIYSFGILLIELGYWETVDRIYKTYKKQKLKDEPGNPPSLADFQKYLAAKCTDSLAFRMGEIYSDAIKFCLNGPDDDEPLGSSGALSGADIEGHLINMFNQLVVAELAKCNA